MLQLHGGRKITEIHNAVSHTQCVQQLSLFYSRMRTNTKVEKCRGMRLLWTRSRNGILLDKSRRRHLGVIWNQRQGFVFDIKRGDQIIKHSAFLAHSYSELDVAKIMAMSDKPHIEETKIGQRCWPSSIGKSKYVIFFICDDFMSSQMRFNLATSCLRLRHHGELTRSS